MSAVPVIICLAASCVLGYFAVVFVLYMEKRKLKSDNQQQGRTVINEARQQAELRNEQFRERLESKLADESEELESNIQGRYEDLKVAETDLDGQDEFVRKEQSRVDKRANDIRNHEKKSSQLAEKLSERDQSITTQNQELISALEESSGLSGDKVKEQSRDEFVRQHQIETQKVLKTLEEDLSASSKKRATRLLNRVQARYAPTFVWPKSINHVEIKSSQAESALGSDECRLILDLRELTEHVTIEFLERTKENHLPSIKLVGGFGVYREAARLALEEIANKGPSQWSRVEQVFNKHKQTLENQAIKLGHHAMETLGIKPVHPEILRMVGNLNWRTSYRQNQFLHTLEVAQLAGVLAHEVGVDPELAKRSGLIHDIGKTIDYRIEGSHAVISGDYADRFGERRVVCDTAMSHHNDLVLETPLSYVLKAADTLSGARPGARVNLEEGYQIRLASIEEAVRSFKGVMKLAIMNGGREVHVEVQTGQVEESELPDLSASIARKIEEEVAYPGQIKVLVSRKFEASAVA